MKTIAEMQKELNGYCGARGCIGCPLYEFTCSKALRGNDKDYTRKAYERAFGRPAQSQKIIIATDGKTTKARLYYGKELIKECEAKCSTKDDFDFLTGAEIALARIKGEDKARPAEYHEGQFVIVTGQGVHFFKIGQIVRLKTRRGHGKWEAEGPRPATPGVTINQVIEDSEFRAITKEDMNHD